MVISQLIRSGYEAGLEGANVRGPLTRSHSPLMASPRKAILLAGTVDSTVEPRAARKAGRVSRCGGHAQASALV